jgi:FkbM family methyltransferase
MHLFKCVTKQHHKELRPAIQALLSDDTIVLDVGAHGGRFTKLFSKTFPRGHIHSFEPGAYARSILQRGGGVALRGLKNVTIHALALGAKEAILHLNVPVKKSGSIGYGKSYMSQEAAEGSFIIEEVPQTMMEGFVSRQGLDRVDFIKADIEGWEGKMLDGASRCLADFQPVLIIEIDAGHLQRAGDDSKTIWNRLLDHGYTGFSYDHATRRFTVRDPGACGDLFFVPKPLLNRVESRAR